MKPLPSMIEIALVLALAAALVACHLALISDLLLAVIILALLVVLVATESNAGECDQPHTESPSVQTTLPAEEVSAAARVPVASRRWPLGSSRCRAFPVQPNASPRSLVAAGRGPAGVTEAVRPHRRTLVPAMVGVRFIN